MSWGEVAFNFGLLALGLILECAIDVWREKRRERAIRRFGVIHWQAAEASEAGAVRSPSRQEGACEAEGGIGEGRTLVLPREGSRARSGLRGGTLGGGTPGLADDTCACSSHRTFP